MKLISFFVLSALCFSPVFLGPLANKAGIECTVQKVSTFFSFSWEHSDPSFYTVHNWLVLKKKAPNWIILPAAVLLSSMLAAKLLFYYVYHINKIKVAMTWRQS